MQFILFYSTKCDSCKNFKKILINEKIIDMFKCVCIDTLPIDKLLKIGIKNVPTLIVKGQNGASYMYECINAFIWLENIIKYRKNTQKKITDIPFTNIVDGYKAEELSGISDKYAFLQTDDAQPKSFLPYGKDDQYRIITLSAPTTQDKLDIRGQQELIKNIENVRSKQMCDIRNTMEKNQIEIINSKIAEY